MRRILVRRAGALGDVILTTPIVRRLKRENPDSEIWVETGYLDVFWGNPDVAGMNGSGPFDRLVNLDFAYELRPRMHVVDAYAQVAFGDDKERWDRQQYIVPRPFSPADHWDSGLWPYSRAVCIHAAVSWPNRTIPQDTWDDVSTALINRGLVPIAVGTPRDMLPRDARDLRGVPDLHQLVGLFEISSCFVGSDSALLHAAGATSVPIVGVFTSVKPEYRMPYGGGCTAVMPRGLGCLGCLADETPPVTYVGCRRGDFACVTGVTADQIVEAVLWRLTSDSETPRRARRKNRGVSKLS